MIRAFALVFGVLVAATVLGYGPVRGHHDVAARAAVQVVEPVAHRAATLDHGGRAKSVWALLRHHVRADDELSRTSAMWDDDDGDDADDSDDLCPLGGGAQGGEDPMAFGLGECVDGTFPRVPVTRALESADALSSFEQGLGPATGHTSLHEKPPRV